VEWNFWRGQGWPYTAAFDTVERVDPVNPFTWRFIKRFSFRMTASGHDHPDDPPGSGIKSWQYLFFDENGNFWPLARAGATWVGADGLNNLDDTFTLTSRYGKYVSMNPDGTPGPPEDPWGDAVFANLPGYVNHDLTVIMKGRDTAVEEGEFAQYMFLGTVAIGAKGVHNFAEQVLINSYPTAVFGRWTPERTFTFHLKFVRDPAPPPVR